MQLIRPAPLITPFRFVLGVAAIALLAGTAVAVAPTVIILPAAVALLLGIAVCARPAFAAYVLLAATPVITGIDRGEILPILRPNEALALLVGAPLLVRGAFRLAAARPRQFQVTGVDRSIAFLAVTGSIMPLLWLLVRGHAITSDDVLYSLTLWKYVAVYLIVRLSIVSDEQVRKCLLISISAAAVVAVIGILQTLDLLGVRHLLATYFVPALDSAVLETSRAASTLSNPQAAADVLVFNLVVASAFLIHRSGPRILLISVSMLFVVGILASGTFSGLLALLVGGAAFLFITRRVRQIAALVPATIAAASAVRPVLEERLSQLDPSTGLPSSWLVRLENLRTYVWPELFSKFNVLLGVRPAARIPSDMYASGYIYIESGHMWLLWTGGIPFFIAFFVFLWTSIRTVVRVARERADAIGVAATGSFAALIVMAVLMTLDPHITLRGSADLNFALLALACTGWRPEGREVAEPDSSPTTSRLDERALGGSL